MTSDSQKPSDPAEPRVMSGAIWQELCDTLRDAGPLASGPTVPESALERAAGLQYLTEYLAAGINRCIAVDDPDHPELTRLMDVHMRWGLNSPDCLYLVAPVREDAVYRLWGDPGTANHLDVQVNTGHPAEGSISAIRTISSISDDTLERGPDGTIELFLGGERRPGNWLPFGAEASHVQIRQNFHDWDRERPAELLIERVGGAPTRPAIRTDEIAARIERLRGWLSSGGALWQKLSGAMLAMEPNTLVAFSLAKDAAHTGLKDQIYCQGNFACAEDEAVLVELAPPPCRHWSLSLANRFWQSIDFATRQSSLNGHQAALDADGVFRAVISHRDPGVPNWLDTGGHERGTIFGRFILAEQDLSPPKLRVVPLRAVQDAVPAETPTVTPAERDTVLRRRREAVWRRHRR